MTLWLVRAGRYGESEEFDLTNNVVAIGWDKLSDLSTINSNRGACCPFWMKHIPTRGKNIDELDSPVVGLYEWNPVGDWLPCHQNARL